MQPSIAAHYDGHADWYDEWAQSDGGPFMELARTALTGLLPTGGGLALDLGCGTGLHAEVVRRNGFQVIGTDYSADQLRYARRRLPVIRADARALPIASGSVPFAYSMLTHTDLDGFDRLVGEAIRVLAPGGVFCYVGIHPCFVGPFVELRPDAVLLHPGYRDVGWQTATDRTHNSVRQRVGVHHLSLQQLLAAFLRPDTRLDSVTEHGNRFVPDILAIRVSRS